MLSFKHASLVFSSHWLRQQNFKWKILIDSLMIIPILLTFFFQVHPHQLQNSLALLSSSARSLTQVKTCSFEEVSVNCGLIVSRRCLPIVPFQLRWFALTIHTSKPLLYILGITSWRTFLWGIRIIMPNIMLGGKETRHSIGMEPKKTKALSTIYGQRVHRWHGPVINLPIGDTSLWTRIIKFSVFSFVTIILILIYNPL